MLSGTVHHPPARDNGGRTLKATLNFLVLAVALALPATAGAHAAIAMDGDTIVYVAIDSTSRSTLTVTVGADSIRLSDPTIDGGIDPGRCDPGAVDRNGYIIEATCARTAETRLRADVGALDDAIEVRDSDGAAPLTTFLLGGAGSDRLVGGVGSDTLDGGAGRDELRAGDGDDELRSRDGNFEIVGCGDGTDRAYLDVPDVGDGCETVEDADPPPPPPDPGQPPGAEDDTTPPNVEATAPRRQRLRGAGALVAFARPDEAATISATATVRLGGRRFNFVSPQQRTEPGARVRLTLRAPRSAVRRLRRALRSRRRAVYATLTVIAIDDAANSAAARAPRIRVAR